VYLDHLLIAKRNEKEMNNSFKSPLEILIAKERIATNINVISNFFGAMDLYKFFLCEPKTNILIVLAKCVFATASF
jgi:hypothetical protein